MAVRDRREATWTAAGPDRSGDRGRPVPAVHHVAPRRAATDDSLPNRDEPDGHGPRIDHRKALIVAVEVVFGALLLAFAALEAPTLLDAIGRGFARLAHPDLVGLALAIVAEIVSLAALAQVPRWLLARGGVRLSFPDAATLAVVANGMAVILPAGTVTSSVWAAHQYTRRGARAALATWVVLAAGFASSVTALALLLVGAMVAHVADEALLLVALTVLVAGSAGFVRLVHRAARLPASGAPGAGASLYRRLLSRLSSLAGDAAGQRAGWRTGGLVLAGSTVNWLGDTACLAATFALLRLPVPWKALLLAYAAGQVVGALVPLPGGLGAVEGGMIGVLVGFGYAAGPALAVVTVYRTLGYWIPTAVSVPAFALVKRRHSEQATPDPGRTPTTGAGGAGLEPATFGSKVRRSAN